MLFKSGNKKLLFWKIGNKIAVILEKTVDETDDK